MDTIYQNEYLTIKIDKNWSVYYWEWKAQTEDMSTEVFLEQCAKLLDEYLLSKCRNLVDNALNLRFAVTPDLQDIIAQQILSSLNGKCDKIAHILSDEIIVALSIEQLWDENKRTYQEKYYSNLEEALSWIKSK